MTEANACLAVVLAAGKGTRMRSDRPKVLHPVAGHPMVLHALDTAREAGADRIAVVVGHGGDAVRAVLPAGAEAFEQTEQLGTAHAVLAARPALKRGRADVLVQFGDTPLLTPDTLRAARHALADGAAVAVVGFEAADPTGYGRLLTENGALAAIREERDATDAERAVTLCNAGIMALAGEHALALLDAVSSDNAKGEYYLTDVVEIARRRGLRCAVVAADETEVMGVNDRVQLAAAEAAWQARRRGALLRAGTAMRAPDTVHLWHDTVVEPDATVEPYVVFGPGATVRAGATVLSHSHIEGAEIGAGASVGPFARLRPGTRVGEGAKVGNFCETKKAEIGPGAKVNHLSYVGDAVIGAGANIGAGTITCNYDGYGKHVTEIGANAFVGSNASLGAPVRVGGGAYVGSGSVVTRDVPADALAIARGRQENREGYGARLRARLAAARAAVRASKQAAE